MTSRGLRAGWNLIVVSLILLSWCPEVFARRDIFKYDTSDSVARLWDRPFGWYWGGLFSIDVTITKRDGSPPREAYVAVFNEAQWKGAMLVESGNFSFETWATLPSALRIVFNESQVSVQDLPISGTDWYELAVVNYFSEQLSIRGESITMNSEYAGQLSMEQSHGYVVVFVLIVGYGLCLFSLVGLSVLVRRISFKLYFLMVAIFLKVFALEMLFLVYGIVMQNGRYDLFCRFLVALPHLLADAFFLHLLLWLTSGEGIVFSHVSFRERAVQTVLIAVYVFLDGFAQFSYQLDPYDLKAFFFWFFFRCYCCLLALYFLSQMNVLIVRMRKIFFVEVTQVKKWALSEKIRFFLRLRILVTVVFVLPLPLLFVDFCNVVPIAQRWTIDAANRVVLLFAYTLVSFWLRPKRTMYWMSDHSVQRYFRRLRRERNAT